MFPIIPILLFIPPSLCFLLTPEGPAPAARRPLFRHSHPGEPDQPANPVVLIPGDGGARLRANLTGKPAVVHYFCARKTKQYFDLWLNLELFSPLVIDCWADNMRLGYNSSSGMAEDLAGVHVRVPGFGRTHSVEWLDASKRSPSQYFASIVEQLVAWGYSRGKDIAGAPYDWRRAPRDLSRYFAKLRALIEQLYTANGQRKVVVLAHSMGNPVANHFYREWVDQAWKDKYLAAHVSLAGAWAGAAQIVKLFAAGYNMDYYRVILPPSRLRQMQRSFLSSAFLFPNAQLWAPNETLASTPRRNYSHANLHEFFADIEYPEGFAQWQSASQTVALDPPDVKVHCIFGTEVQTAEQFEWKYNWLFPDYQPTVKYGNGDGTVNERSLEVCAKWTAEGNGGHAVEVSRLNGADHMSILGDARMLALLKGILYGANAASAR